MFRYVTDAEADQERARGTADLEKAANARRGVTSDTSQKPAEAPAPKPQASTPDQKTPDAPPQKAVEPPQAK